LAGALDARVACLAARQHGNVTRAQLHALGLGDGAIAHRLRSGRIYRVFRGVYAVGRPASGPLELASAAVLACGAGAALSHFSALALWGLRNRWPRTPEVASLHDHRPAGIEMHKLSSFAPRELTIQRGIRTTSPARTVLDCARRLQAQGRLERTINDALLTPYLFEGQLAEVCARHPRHPGARLLRPFVERDGGPTRSGWEDEFPAWCERYGLPRPKMNVVICGVEVDAWFERERVAAELDGWRFHRSRASFEANRERDTVLLASAGVITVRLTRRHVLEQPERFAGLLAQILARRRGELGRR
jgi:hypothetical protein